MKSDSNARVIRLGGRQRAAGGLWWQDRGCLRVGPGCKSCWCGRRSLRGAGEARRWYKEHPKPSGSLPEQLQTGKEAVTTEFGQSSGKSAIMKLLHEADDATNNRKLIKSQVEKRRRERINRSLEHLRTMLLQEPQQGGTKHRVEKAEILEHTVLFLQKTAKEHKAKAGGQKHSFQDGVSTCLQRASHFLGPEGKGLWLGPALDATFSARFARSDSDSSGAPSRTSSSLTYTKSILQMLRQKSKYRQHTRALGLSSLPQPHLFPVQQSFPRAPQQPQRQSRLEMRAEGSATKESSSQSCPLSQTLWRPWP